MSMKRKLLTLLLFAAIILGCDKPKELGEFLLGDYKEYNPFNGSEILVYRHSVNDSIFRFYGGGRYSEIYHTVPTNNPTTNYWVNECNYSSFSTQDGRFSLTINMATHLSTSVEMYLRYKEQVRPETFYGIGPTYYLPLSIEVFNHPSPYQDKFYLDSIQVFDRNYKEVFADSALFGGFSYAQRHLTPNIRPTTFFYTVKEGIIKIDFNDDSYWGLTEIISP